MKIRVSNVTNSSSTSFCIIGREFDASELIQNEHFIKKIKELLPDYVLDKDENNVMSDLLYELKRIHKEFSGYDSHSQYGDDNVYFGKDIHACDENKTIKEHKEEVTKVFNDLFGDKKNAEILTDGWYDG